MSAATPVPPVRVDMPGREAVGAEPARSGESFDDDPPPGLAQHRDPTTRLGPWRITRVLGRDLCGIHYAGCRNDGVRATLYLLSGERATIDDELLAGLIERHHDVCHPGLVRLRAIDRDGCDRYLIADPVDDALESLHAGHCPGPAQVGPFGAALAAALAVAHDRGLVHGGLDLGNVLWAPGRAPQILGTGVAALGLADRAGLARGDVAALGRLLCALLAGRRPARSGGARGDGPTRDHLGEVTHRIVDPGATISMREAHALLAEGEPTQTARRGGAAGEPITDAAQPSGSAPGADDLGRAPGPPGHQVGRYRILTRLGRGGMGEVFLAEDPALRRGVAIKQIRPGLERDRLFRARLRREAQLAAHLHHRAIVQVFDLVTDDTADHVVMEYVPGPSLHTLVGINPPDMAEVLRIAAEIADGLAYAHQHGIIHRDLKLENVLIGADHQPKIADFGLAHSVAGAADDASLADEGYAVGTSRAMSPEQARGHSVDVRSDLFSLGVMLYELVTGTSPFAAGSGPQTIQRVLHHRPPPARELAPGVPGALSDLIDELLEKLPAHRPGSALVVRDRLRALRDGAEPAAGPPRAEPAPAPAGAAIAADATRKLRPATDPGATAPTAHRGRTLRAMGIAFAVSLGVGLLQLAIAWAGGVATDGRAEGALPRAFIGYLSSYHWWVSYAALVPPVVACSLPAWTAFAELSTRGARIARAAVLAASLATAGGFVLSEVSRALWRVPLDACQWNYLDCRPHDHAFSPALRAALMVLGYLHELVGYTGFTFTVIGVVVVCWLSRRASALAARDRVVSLLFNQRLCVGIYLGYLVILRSSKVGSYLSLNGKAEATVAGMVLHWGSYFNVIRYGMGWTLLVGAVSIAAALASHLVVAHAGVHPVLPDDARGVPLLIAEAGRLAGRAFSWFVLVAIVFIVLPPPGWLPLFASIAVIAVIAGIAGLAEWQRRRAWYGPASP